MKHSSEGTVCSYPECKNLARDGWRHCNEHITRFDKRVKP